MSLINVGICGASGRMGKALVNAVTNNDNLKLVAALEQKDNKNIGKDAGEVAGCGKIEVPILADEKEFFSKSDGVIDFTIASASVNNIKLASEFHCSYVLGTTGFDSEQLKIIENLSNKVPMVCSANMSIGVNVILHYANMMAKNLGEDYDAEIFEIHHNDKIDSPSGTALALGKAIAKGREIVLEDNLVKGRWGTEDRRKKGVIGFSTARGGDVIGDHTVTFAGIGERIELSHKAGNRDIFANGALKALLWIKDQPPGFYSMADVLGLS